MNTNVTPRPPTRPPLSVSTLARGPRDLGSPRLRAVVTALILAGAALTVVSGVIHLYLWGQANGYRQIPTIGPLFLAQGISAIAFAVAGGATRRLAAVLAAAGLLASTAAGLAITVQWGMFGFRESWSAPYALTSLYEEIAGALLLIIAAWPLARAAQSPGR